MKRWALAMLWLLAGAAAVFGGVENPARYAQEVAALEAHSRALPAPTNAVLFIGSSNIRMWSTLAEDFPAWPVINHGFGGSHLSDVAFYVDRLVVPFRPRAVVISAGANDIHFGRTPEEVLGAATDAVGRVQAALPGVPVVFAGLLPAPSRIGERARVHTANRLIAAWTQTRPGVAFVDASDVFERPDGTLREDRYIGDRLHHTREGYRLRAERLRPALERALAGPVGQPE